jgi:hypothetical protein
MMFSFIAKPGDLAVSLICEALDVSRSGFYVADTAARTRQEHEALTGRKSFLDMTGPRARRVWRDVLAAGSGGPACGRR